MKILLPLLIIIALAFSTSHIPVLIIDDDDSRIDPSLAVDGLSVIPGGLAGGCGPFCEDLSDYDESVMFVVANERNFFVEIILAAGVIDRTAIQNAPVMVHITSKGEDEEDPTDDTEELRLAYTNDEGIANFDFNAYKTSCHDYKFIYCYSPLACGINNCFTAIGLDPEAAGLGEIGGVADIPLASGVVLPVDPQNPSKVLSAFASYKYCPPPPPIGGVMPAFCLPLVVIFSLLMGALHLSGRNPFGMFDFSAPRAGKHLRYTARGRGFGFDVMGIAVGLAKGIMAGTSESGRAVLGAEDAEKGGGFAAALSGAGYGTAMKAFGNLKATKGFKSTSPTAKMSLGQLFKTAPSRLWNTVKEMPSAGLDFLKNKTDIGKGIMKIIDAKDFLGSLRAGLDLTSFAPLSRLAFSIATAIEISGDIEAGIRKYYDMNVVVALGYKDTTTQEKKDAKEAEVNAARGEVQQAQTGVDKAEEDKNKAQQNVDNAQASVANAQAAVAACNEPGACSAEEKREAQVQLNLATMQLGQAQQQLAAAQDVLGTRQTELAAAQAMFEYKKQELAVVTIQLNIETNKINLEEGQKKLEEAKENLAQAQENAAKFEGQATEARDQATAKADELAKAKEEGAPKTEIQALENELKAANAKATAAEETAAKTAAAVTQTEATVQAATGAVDTSTKQLRDAEDSLKGAQEILATAQKNFEVKLDLVQQKMDGLKDERDQATAKAEELGKAKEEGAPKEKIDILEKELEAAQKKAEKAEAVIATLAQDSRLADERKATIEATGNLDGLKKKTEEDMARLSKDMVDATKELDKAKTDEQRDTALIKFEEAKAALAEAHMQLEGIKVHGAAEISLHKAYDELGGKAGGTVAALTVDSSGKPVLTFYFVSSEEERKAALEGGEAAKGLTGRKVSDWNTLSDDDKKALAPSIQEALSTMRAAALTIQVHSSPEMSGLGDRKEDTVEALHDLLKDKTLTGMAADLQRAVAAADGEGDSNEKAKKVDQIIKMLSDPRNSNLFGEVGGALGDKQGELLGLRKDATNMRAFEQQAITANLLYNNTGALLEGNPSVDKNMKSLLESHAQVLAYTGVTLSAIGDATEKVDPKKFDDFLEKSRKAFEYAETAISKVTMQSALYSANPNFDLNRLDVPDRPNVSERDLYLAATTLAQTPGTDKQNAERLEMVAATAEFIKQNPQDAQDAILLLKGVSTSLTESSPDASKEMQKIWKDYMAAPSENRDALSARAFGLDAVGNMGNAAQQVGLSGIDTGVIWSFREQLVAELEKRVERDPALQVIIDKLDTPSTAQREDLIAAVAQYGDNGKVDKFIQQHLEGDAKKEYEGLMQQVQNLEQKADEFSKDYKPGKAPEMDIVDRLKTEIISNPAYDSLFVQRDELETTQEQIERKRKEDHPETGRGPLQIIKESMEKAERDKAEAEAQGMGYKPAPVEEQYTGHPLAKDLASPTLSPTNYYKYDQPEFLGGSSGMRYNPMTGRYERI